MHTAGSEDVTLACPLPPKGVHTAFLNMKCILILFSTFPCHMPMCKLDKGILALPQHPFNSLGVYFQLFFIAKTILHS